MTAPVPVYPNSTIAGARRTARGAFRLIPTPEVRNIIVYLFVHYAKRYNIRLLTLVIMSNHLHWVLDDPDGNYPQFLATLYSRITEVLNDYHRTSGPMWENCKPQRTRLLDQVTIERKLLYAATNASWHGTSRRSRRWKGFVFSPEDVGSRITAECPKYLRENYASFPESYTYIVPKPAAYAHLTDAQVRRHFRKRRLRRELAIRHERKDEFGDPDKALLIDPNFEPDPTDDPRDLTNKLFDGATEEVLEAGFADLDHFRRRYGKSRKRFRGGDRDVEWPHGTWAMQRWHRCPTCPG